MMHVMEYRRHAEQCRAMARSARNRVRRAQFLQLAKQWDGIAEEREKLLELEKKIGQPLTSDTAVEQVSQPSRPVGQELTQRAGRE